MKLFQDFTGQCADYVSHFTGCNWFMSSWPNQFMLPLFRRPSTVLILFLAVTCSELSPPTNGELLGCNTTELLYNTVCRFSCKEGFEAKGSTVRRCTENGTWSGTDLDCPGDYYMLYCLVISAYSIFQLLIYNKLWLVSFLFAAAKCWWYNSRSNSLIGTVVLHEATKMESHTFCWLSFIPSDVTIVAYLCCLGFLKKKKETARVVHKTKSQCLSQICENLDFSTQFNKSNVV